MREIKLVSPLLDHMAVAEALPPRGNTACYILTKEQSDTRFFLKHISLPESESSIRALILAGAVSDEAGAHAYYGRMAEDYRSELDTLVRLSESPNIARIAGYQIVPKESGVGYDVYILSKYRKTLADFLAENAMTNLHAVNLGIDLCSALRHCRENGFLFQDLKPENVFVDEQFRFQLGGLGLAATEDLQYASVPENYIGCYTAPELCGISASLNLTADLYALGLILYRIYNGNHAPFEDEETSEKAADRLRLSGRELPAPLYADYELAEIINKACAFHPENRFQTPDDLQQALVQYMQRNSVTDSLIVPPIITDEQPLLLTPEDEQELAAPLSATDVSALDAQFVESFTPDFSAPDIAPEEAAAPQADEADAAPATQPEPAAEPEEAPAAQPEPATEPQETPTEEAASAAAPEADAPAAAEAEAEPSAPAEADDPDSLDALLNDVGALLGDYPQAEEQPTEDAPADYVDGGTPTEDDTAVPPSGKGKRLAVTIGCLALVLVLLGLGFYFVYTKWYCVKISALSVTNVTTDELTVRVDSESDSPAVTFTCIDTYHNSFVGEYENGFVTFRGLKSGTDYTVVLSAEKHHKLVGVSEIPVTTCVPTEITEFSVTDGQVSGAALLRFSYDGTAPAEWSLTYASENAAAKTIALTGCEYELSGLNLNETYTFTLNSTGGVFLSGETTTTYYTLPIVKAENMLLADITEGSLRVEWTLATDSYTPASWSVTCADDRGYSQTVSVSETTATFDGITPDHSYTITLTAEGMREPYITTLAANPLMITNLAATANGDGSVTVTWSAPNGAPDGGWLITYGIGAEAYLQQADSVSGTSYTIAHAIPNADYFITLSSTDNSTVIGEKTVSVTTPAAERFDSYRVTPSYVYMAFFLEPTKSNWTYVDLSERRSSFSPDESVSFVAQISGVSVEKSNDSIHILCVVRNSDGTAIDYFTADSTWNEMWYRSRYCGTLPRTPQEAGEYTVEIYLNQALLKSHSFTIE